MKNGKKINRKKLKECLTILILIAIVFLLISKVRKTYSRYQSDVSVNIKDLKIAFSILDNDLATSLIDIDDIYPSDQPFDYTFTVSNFMDLEIVDENNVVTNSARKVAETAMEYDITIQTTTNLPLEYELYYEKQKLMSTSYNGGEISNTVPNVKNLTLSSSLISKNVNYLNEAKTEKIYYNVMTAYASSNGNKLTMDEYDTLKIVPETKEYTLRIIYPKSKTMIVNDVVEENVSITENLSFSTECIKVTINARQKID